MFTGFSREVFSAFETCFPRILIFLRIEDAINFVDKNFSFSFLSFNFSPRTKRIFACFPLKFRNTSEPRVCLEKSEWEARDRREKSVFHWKLPAAHFHVHQERIFLFSPMKIKSSSCCERSRVFFLHLLLGFQFITTCRRQFTTINNKI